VRPCTPRPLCLYEQVFFSRGGIAGGTPAFTAPRSWVRRHLARKHFELYPRDRYNPCSLTHLWGGAQMSNTAGRWEAALQRIIMLEVVALVVLVCGMVIYPPGVCGGSNRVTSLRLSAARQIAQAHLAYAQDYDERFCPAVVDNPASEPPKGTDYAASWMRLLGSYVESQGVFYLPAQATPRGVSREQTRTRAWGMPMRWRFYSGSDPSPTNMWKTPFGEAMMDGIGGYHRVGDSNYFGSGPAQFCEQRRGKLRPEVIPSYSTADIARPAETVLVLEALSFEYGMTCRLRVPAPRDAVDKSSSYHGLNFAPRLQDGYVYKNGYKYRTGHGFVAYADGHAKRIFGTESLFAIHRRADGAPYYRMQYVRE